jgi:hypothetical protein
MERIVVWAGEREETDDARDEALSLSELVELVELNGDESDDGESDDDDEGHSGVWAGAFFTFDLFLLAAVLRALRSVACVSLRCTISNSSL